MVYYRINDKNDEFELYLHNCMFTSYELAYDYLAYVACRMTIEWFKFGDIDDLSMEYNYVMEGIHIEKMRVVN